MIETVKFTHAKFNTDVYIYPTEIYAVTLEPTLKLTIVVGRGGASVPVVGTVEEALIKINAAKEADRKKVE